MRRVGQTRRRDANEKAIVAGLRALGAHVTPISGVGAPDVLVAFRGRLYAFEVKSVKGTRTAAQELSQWPIVRSMDEALKHIGAIRASHGAKKVKANEDNLSRGDGL